MDFPTPRSRRGRLLPEPSYGERLKLNYRLIFKNPESGKSVASMDIVSIDEDAAVARFRDVAGYMEGELWHGETQLRAIAPEPAQPTR